MNSKKRLKRQIREQSYSMCVSNATNSRLPDDLKSRIFIGNLNTGIVTKRHLHLIFIQFGDIKAISMHKGYAFIQFNDEMDALNAVFAQDGQLIAGQTIDVNLVTEPKPHQKSNKQLMGESNESDWSEEMHSIDNAESVSHFENNIKNMLLECNDVNETIVSLDEHDLTLLSSKANEQTDKEDDSFINKQNNDGNAKRVKLDSDENVRFLVNNEELIIAKQNSDDLTILEKRSNEEVSHEETSEGCSASHSTTTVYNISNCITPNQRIDIETVPLAFSQIQAYDILICGNCRNLFTSLSLFIQHKRNAKCRLRFVCRCHQKK